jgi:hypothetical protein
MRLEHGPLVCHEGSPHVWQPAQPPYLPGLGDIVWVYQADLGNEDEGYGTVGLGGLTPPGRLAPLWGCDPVRWYAYPSGEEISPTLWAPLGPPEDPWVPAESPEAARERASQEVRRLILVNQALQEAYQRVGRSGLVRVPDPV